MRHGQAAAVDVIVFDIHAHAAAGLVLAPASGRVGGAERGDVFGPAVHHLQSVEVAAIFGGVAADEFGSPARHKAVVFIQRAQAGELGVDQPQFIACVGHFVNVDVAGDVCTPRHEGG